MNSTVSELIAGMPRGGLAAMEITPALYRDLRRIAARHLGGERRNHTLQATALVHESYLKLVGAQDQQFADGVHFLAVASRAMRQVLVDYARSRMAQKRDGGSSLGPSPAATPEVNGDHGPDHIDLMALDDALAALAAEDGRLASLIEMRYFGGMTAEESAEVLGISVHVVRHDLRFAQAWLRRRLNS